MYKGEITEGTSCSKGLKCDLYELTMAAGYFLKGMNYTAVFEVFVRRMPLERSYFVFIGLEQVLEFIREFRFSEKDIDFLRSLEIFKSTPDEFFDFLIKLRFTGDVWAMPEGSYFFANEPVLQIKAPLIQAQLLESAILAILNLQCTVGTKAHRILQAAKGRTVVDFGMRRAHGFEAGLYAARASYIAGCNGTSNCLASKLFGIPTYGTTAHSWVMTHQDERTSFVNFHDLFPEDCTLIVDTYNTIKGIRQAIDAVKGITAIRLDSGNIVKLSKKARRMLNKAGMRDTKIIASGNLDEYEIQRLLSKKARIDLFFVGTSLVTAPDSPSLDCVYKLVEQEDKDGNPIFKTKTSRDKKLYTGQKQVYRFYDRKGRMKKDLIKLAHDKAPKKGKPLLEKYMENGELVHPLPDLEEIRSSVHEKDECLKHRYRRLTDADEYPVHFSKHIKSPRRAKKLFNKLNQKVTPKENRTPDN